MYVALRRCSAAFATRATLQPSPTSRCLLLRLRFKSHPPRRPNFEAVCEAEADLSTPLLLKLEAAVVRVDASFELHLLASFRRVSTHHSGFDLLPDALYDGGSVLNVDEEGSQGGLFGEFLMAVKIKACWVIWYVSKKLHCKYFNSMSCEV